MIPRHVQCMAAKQSHSIFPIYKTLLVLLLASPLFLDAASAQEKVSIGITNSATDAGFFIAERKGYFRAEGIEVTTTPFASAAGMIAPLGRGQLDVGAGTVAAGFYNAVEPGIPLRVAAEKGPVSQKREYSATVSRRGIL